MTTDGAQGPLQGLRVLDLTEHMAGPFCTMILAERHRQMVVTVDDPELGTVPHIRRPVRLSASRVAVRTVAPKLGEHTDAVLAALGYGRADIDELRRGAGISR